MKDTRRSRLSTACSIAGISITECASRLGVTRNALYDWARRGDPASDGLTLAHKASRARLGDEGPLTADRIAAVLGCPAEALHPGGPVPTWSGDASLLAPVLDALGRPPSATVQQAVAAIDGLRASALAVLETGEELQAADDVAWALVEPVLTAGRALVNAVQGKNPRAVESAREALDAALRELE